MESSVCLEPVVKAVSVPLLWYDDSLFCRCVADASGDRLFVKDRRAENTASTFQSLKLLVYAF